MKNVVKLCLFTMLLASFSCSKDSPLESHDLTVDVFSPILGEITGTSTLTRTKSNITVSYTTKGLTPGYCYTLWWVVWNNPEECNVPGACDGSDFEKAEKVEVEVMYATGQQVTTEGAINFTAQLSDTDTYVSSNALFGLPPAGGLQKGNALNAQIFAVIRSHGPAIPGKVEEQIGSYEGGCLDPLAIAPFTEIPDEVGECGDIELAVFPAAN